jgi:hypothetical protein
MNWFICVIRAAFVCVSNYTNSALRLSFCEMKWNGPNSPCMQTKAPNSYNHSIFLLSFSLGVRRDMYVASTENPRLPKTCITKSGSHTSFYA